MFRCYSKQYTGSNITVCCLWFNNKRQARGCNQLINITSEEFLHISVAPFTQWLCCCWNDLFHSLLYLYINRYVSKNWFLLYLNALMLKTLEHEAILLTFPRMKWVYFVFSKFNSQLLRIRKVVGWELSAKQLTAFSC